MIRAELWGDSIGKGVLFDEVRGRYAIAKNHFIKLLKHAGIADINSHARFGATVEEGLQDFEATRQVESDIVVIEFGGNDCDMPWENIAREPQADYQAKTPLALFEKKIEAFVLAVRERGLRPLLVTPPPLDAQRFFAWVSRGLNARNILGFVSEVPFIYRWHEQYSLAVRRAAQKTACRLFDLRDAFLSERDLRSALSIDGIHPNERGHVMIADAVANFIVNL